MAKQKSRTLPLYYINELAKQLKAHLIMTKYDDLVVVDINSSIVDAIRKMEPNEQGGSKFDQLPVEEKGSIVGVIRYNSIKNISRDASLKVNMYLDKSVAIVAYTEPLGDMIGKLVADSCVLVSNGREINGLIHWSDLNKQAVRLYFYIWLTSVEMGLLEKLKQKYGPSEDWMNLLDSKSKIRVLENLSLALSANLDIYPLEYCDFSDLINIVTKDKYNDIRHSLGFNSKSSWKKASGKLVCLRNKIMHPVRTLVNEGSNIKNLHECNESLKSIVKNISSV